MNGTCQSNVSRTGTSLASRREIFRGLGTSTEYLVPEFPSCGGSIRIRMQSLKRLFAILRSNWKSLPSKIIIGRNTRRRKRSRALHSMRHHLVFGLLSAWILASVAGCSGQNSNRTSDSNTSSSTQSNVSLNKNDYPVFPDADSGADPSVPAEQGGKGFDGKGWETNTDFDLIGDPHAVKGGILRDWMMSFTGTLRMGGPEWNTGTNYMISSLVYESLVGLNPTTYKYMPSLATHWKISPDKMTFWFR